MVQIYRIGDAHDDTSCVETGKWYVPAEDYEKLFNAARALIDGLNNTHWSGWQTTAYFDEEQQKLESILKELK